MKVATLQIANFFFVTLSLSGAIIYRDDSEGTLTDPISGYISTISVGGGSPALSASPATSSTGLTGVSIALTGSLTSWISGTPGTPTFTLSGGTGASIASQRVADSAHATVVPTAGSAAGVLTIPDPVNSTTATVTLSAPNVTVPFTNTTIFVSPYNWYSDGGTLQANNVRASSTYIRSNNPGAYIKTGFTGTSIKVNIDASNVTSGIMPIVKWSIDNASYQIHQLTSPSETHITLGTGLASGKHTLFLYIRATDYTVDRWTTPVQAIKLTAIVLDSGASTLAPFGAVELGTKRIIFYGDSITEGAVNIDGATLVEASDSYLSWITPIAEAFGAEYANIGFIGQAWSVGASNVPGLSTSWSLYSAGLSRLISSKLAPIPTYVVVNMGSNTGDGDITTPVSTWIGNMRAAVNSTTPIFLIIPFGQQNRTTILNGITKSGDTHAYSIDLGTTVALSLPGLGSASRDTRDGLHPSSTFDARLGAMITKKMQAALCGGTAEPGAGISFQ